MKALTHIETALKEIDDEVQTILMNPKLSLNEKDDLMLPLVRQKKVLQQTLEDLIWLQDNPPTQKGGCGMARYRDD
jgi:hypothetical protein